MYKHHHGDRSEYTALFLGSTPLMIVKVYGTGTQVVYGTGALEVYGTGTQERYGTGTQEVYGTGTQKGHGTGTQEVYGTGTLEAYNTGSLKIITAGECSTCTFITIYMYMYVMDESISRGVVTAVCEYRAQNQGTGDCPLQQSVVGNQIFHERYIHA